MSRIKLTLVKFYFNKNKWFVKTTYFHLGTYRISKKEDVSQRKFEVLGMPNMSVIRLKGLSHHYHITTLRADGSRLLRVLTNFHYHIDNFHQLHLVTAAVANSFGSTKRAGLAGSPNMVTDDLPGDFRTY